MSTIATRTGLQAPQLADTPADIEAAVVPLRDRLESIMSIRRSVLIQAPVLDVGQVGQIKAGRQLTPVDFTALGLSAPLGLWNLGDLTDASGNARALTNKGTVPFGVGINGLAATAAQFAGSTAQALYRADTGAADPFRIRTGSWGCWFRTAKRGVAQAPMGKYGAAQQSWLLLIGSTNVLGAWGSLSGSDNFTATGVSDVCDDRWHFAVATHDGTRLRLYIDGALEASVAMNGVMFGSSAAADIGGYAADAGTATTAPFYGRVDEAFVTGDVLSPEQVFNLYCARIAHGLVDASAVGMAPAGARLSVRRRRRGGALTPAAFPATPVRLHRFDAGSYADAGSGGVALTPNPGTGAIVDVADADGSAGGAKSFSGAHTGLSATDAGLPAALAARSYGLWFKASNPAANQGLMAWGTITTGDARMQITSNPAGAINCISGPDGIVSPVVTDGLWHCVVAVEDNAAADGVKRKLYLDGRLVGGSTVLTSLVPAGANRFRVGAIEDGTLPLTGQVDDAFVYAGALTGDQVRALYNIGSQQFAASPKTEGDHVEAMDATNLLVAFDALEGVDLVDLAVAA